ncbi:MAG: hypothetical protein JXM70_00290 [Pirellulales bacterium]|nr:hypothetical protein [Pirellulales bacterium]
MSEGRIADHEVLYRRIPPTERYFQPPDRITSANFKLRSGELGISVYRAVFVDAAGVLNKPGVTEGYRIAYTTAGQIRAARNGKDEPLYLDVISVSDENDPGHAEIRSPNIGKISSSAANALRKLFQLVESSTINDE